jgi:hypothetical protein
MHVEDHPLEYGGFEGVIPEKQYGGGTVMLWDRGTWRPKEDPEAGYAKGHLKFELDGENLKGGWTLVRTRGSKYGGKVGRQGVAPDQGKRPLCASRRASHRRDRGEERDDRPQHEGDRRGTLECLAVEAVGRRECEGRRDCAREEETGRRRPRRRAAQG